MGLLDLTRTSAIYISGTAAASMPQCPNGHGRMTLSRRLHGERRWGPVWYVCLPSVDGQPCEASLPQAVGAVWPSVGMPAETRFDLARIDL